MRVDLVPAALARWPARRHDSASALLGGGSGPVSAELVARAVAATGSGVVIADATGVDLPLTYVNEAFTELTGYAAEECLGRNCRFLQCPATDRRTVADLGAALRGEREIRAVLLNHRKDGTSFHNELRLSPVRDEHGRVVQVVGVQHDVTALVCAQHALELDRDRANAELEDFRDALAPTAITSRPRLQISSVFMPAEQGVSGDFQLVLPGPGSSTILIVGDVMGHGLSAARCATFVRASFATSARYIDDPARLLALANRALIEKAGTSADFVTAVCVVHHPEEGVVRWASAGHPIPLALDTGTPIGTLEHVGIALGVSDEDERTTGQARLEPGEGLLLSTDGLAEARDAGASSAATRRLGDARVGELLRQLAGQSPEAVVETLCAAAYLHTDGVFTDDLCLLVARAR